MVEPVGIKFCSLAVYADAKAFPVELLHLPPGPMDSGVHVISMYGLGWFNFGQRFAADGVTQAGKNSAVCSIEVQVDTLGFGCHEWDGS